MHGKRLGAALTTLALLFTMGVGIAGASDLTPGPLVQASGTSPFLGCTADAIGRPVRHGLPEQRGRALDRRQPDQPEQRRRHLAAGPLVERRRAWARGRRQLQRRRELARSCRSRRRPSARAARRRTAATTSVPPTRGSRSARTGRVPAEPVVQRRRAAVHDDDFDHALLASRSTNGGLTGATRSSCRRDTAPTVFNDKQSITADPTNADLRLRGLGPPRLPRPASGRASSPRSARARSAARSGSRGAPNGGPDVGAGAPDLRPGPERPDDRQPDRRPAERHARGHLHRVQQREHEEAPRRRSCACCARPTRA